MVSNFTSLIDGKTTAYSLNMTDEKNQLRTNIKRLVEEVLSNTQERNEAVDFTPQHIVVNSLKNRAESTFERDESEKALITEVDLRGLEIGDRLRVSERVKFTPLASDLIAEKNIQLIYKESRRSSYKVSTIALGADHGGFELKEHLKHYLKTRGFEIRDFGTNSKEAVDYPDLAHLVANAVSQMHVEVGIIIDGAGIGSSMAANKVPNVRAAACYSAKLAKNSREHNGANVLTLGSGITSTAEAEDIVEAFLTTEISEDRHIKRVKKIDAISKQYSK